MDSITSHDEDAGSAAFLDGALAPLGPVPKYMQRDGDPQRGYHALLNEGYVGCGVPYSVYQLAGGSAPESLRLPNRDGKNATLPYNFTVFRTQSGVDVATPNCLFCHASVLQGRVIIGLGDPNLDFTNDTAQTADAAGAVVTLPDEIREWRKWADRLDATGPYTVADVVGVNPADNLGLVLFAHHDQATLAWSQSPLMELPPKTVVPVDVPPWWRMWKKNAMFYNAQGRGDHARIEMTASVLCVDSVNEAEYIDSYFGDINAFIESLRAPSYPKPVDGAKAAAGKPIFDANCARCHGTPDAYPNLIVGLDDVGTDPLLATGSIDQARRFREWFNGSFYGELAQLEPARGYIAPPLDGIWATAPYLHNGSVPDLETLLDSTKRPKYFTRPFDPAAYDLDKPGYPFTPVDHGHDGEPDPQKRKLIYDTTLPGYSNAGHTYGDALTPEQRAAVIAYLKTL